MPAHPASAPPRRRVRRRWLRCGTDGLRRRDDAHPRCVERGGRAPGPREQARGAVRTAALPRLPDRDALSREGAGGRPADPRSLGGRPAASGARALRPACRGANPRRLRCARRGPGLERVRRCHLGTAGPSILHVTGRRDYELIRATVRRDDYRVVAETDQFGAALSAVDLVLGRSGSTVWEIAAAGRPAIFVPYPFATGDHQAANAEHFARAGGAIMVREPELGRVPGLVDSLLTTTTGSPGWERRCSRPPSRMPRTRSPTSSSRWPADEGTQAVVRGHRRRRAERLRAAGAGVGRRPSAVGTACGRRTLTRSTAWTSRSRRSRSFATAGRQSSPRPTRRFPASAVPSSCASSSRRARSIVVAGTHGKGTTAAMIAFVAARDRARPGVADRRSGAAARVECGVRVRVPRRRGRRIRSLRLRVARRDRRLHEPRARPPHRVRLDRGAGGRVRHMARTGGHGRARRATVRRGARGAGGAEPAERGLGHCRARGGGRLARGGCPGARPLHGHRAPLRAAPARRPGRRRRLRPSSDRGRENDRSRARTVSRPQRCAFSSSRTSTPARGTWPGSWRTLSAPPTT